MTSTIRIASLAALTLLAAGCVTTTTTSTRSAPIISTATVSPAAVPTAAFPPQTVAALVTLGNGTHRPYMVVDDQAIGISGCTGRSVTIVVPRHDTKRQVIADMANVYANTLHATQVSGSVFADFGHQSSDGFSAGRLIVDSNCTGYHGLHIEIDTGSPLSLHKVAVIRY